MNTRLASTALVLTFMTGACAEPLRLDSVGARVGLSSDTTELRFVQSEAFVVVDLPWTVSLGRSWTMATEAEASVGWLAGYYDGGIMGTLGPRLRFGRPSLPVALVGGVDATLLSRQQYVVKDFGVPFQFTSHIGLAWRVGEHVEVGYRFQHMSNAHLSDHNPGLNLHMFSVGYCF